MITYLILCVYMYVYIYIYIIEGSLEAKLPTIWRDGTGTARKLGRGESQKGEGQRWRKSEERRCRCAKGREVVTHCVFPVFCGSGGSKGRLAKAAGAEVAAQMRDEKLHAIVARSTF